MAADYLHTAAVYNQLIFEYGADAIQAIMAEGLGQVIGQDPPQPQPKVWVLETEPLSL